MLLNRIGRPSIYIPVCMMVWGMISILTGEPSQLDQAQRLLTICVFQEYAPSELGSRVYIRLLLISLLT